LITIVAAPLVASPQIMANDDPVTGDLSYADRLWKAADALRGQVDAAGHDTFASRLDNLRAELT